MPKTKLEQLVELGQSIWLDNINRSMIKSGRLRQLVEQGLQGLTSNPTIFDKAVSSGDDYDKKIMELKNEGKSTFEVYDCLTIADVCDAADIFKPVFEKTLGRDGFVSLEIDPRLANDIQASIAAGKRLFRTVNRRNLMIKVPATDAGFKVTEELLSQGINVNVTLIFSQAQYMSSAEAFLKGMLRLIESEPDLAAKTHSVASIFVSRLDTRVDSLIRDYINNKKSDLRSEVYQYLLGKAAVANCRLILRKHSEIFSENAFQKFKDKGVDIQRIVWASTSTKNPEYSDIKYVTQLLFPLTVNTLPEKTLEAFLGHGVVKEAPCDWDNAKDVINNLKKNGIDIDVLCLRLLEQGILAFQESFQSLLNSIEEKTQNLSALA